MRQRVQKKMLPTKLFKEFLESEKAGGMILILCTLTSLILANSVISTQYHNLWLAQFAGHSIKHWINDGLMTIFFLLIGLELEREIHMGELSNIKDALLPLFSALGGMIIPAGLFLWFNYGTATQSGAGIPMATDIAFALGILSLLGNKVPTSLKVFLTALAVIDDLGAILVIAIFYTQTLLWSNLLIALGIFVILLSLNKFKVRSLTPYLIGGVSMWYFMLHSGVHATITGVLLAFAIPFSVGDNKSPSATLEHFLNKPVAFIVLPLFVMANTCLLIEGNWTSGLLQVGSLGVVIGLVVGKPMGIWFFSFIGVKLGLCTLPSDFKWRHILGVGFLGGIGFTMSIFISILAFSNAEILNNLKIAILVGSTISGIIGYLCLRMTFKNTPLGT